MEFVLWQSPEVLFFFFRNLNPFFPKTCFVLSKNLFQLFFVTLPAEKIVVKMNKKNDPCCVCVDF